MNHSFDVEVAKEVGVIAAVIFQNIAFWCEHSRANESNFNDGYYWTYNTNKALCELFPYLSSKSIRTAIQKLIDADLIMTGNYNKMAYDRTMWYALSKKGKSIFQKGQIHLPETANGSDQNGEPIPDINPDINTDIYISRKSAESEIPSGFTEFYSLYPRKVSKAMAIKAWEKLNPDDSLLDTILADVRRRVNGEWAGKELQYVPHPSTYLNQRRWEDETATTDRVEAEEEHDLPLEEILRRGDDCSVPEGFTPCGGW